MGTVKGSGETGEDTADQDSEGIVEELAEEEGGSYWRERKPHLGVVVQMDESHQAWLEGRGTDC